MCLQMLPRVTDPEVCQSIPPLNTMCSFRCNCDTINYAQPSLKCIEGLSFGMKTELYERDVLLKLETHTLDRQARQPRCFEAEFFVTAHSKHQFLCNKTIQQHNLMEQCIYKTFILCSETDFFHIPVKYHVLAACNISKLLPIHTCSKATQHTLPVRTARI